MSANKCLAAATLTVLVSAAACSKSPQALFDSGNSYFAKKQYRQAIVQFRNVIQKQPTFGEAHARLAEAYAAEGDARNAYREYVRAADLLPDDAAVQLKAGQFLLVANRFDDAKMRAERALKRDPRNVDAELLRAHALVGLKDLDGALRDVENAISLDVNRSTTYYSLGALQVARGDRQEAEASFNKAVALNPKAARPHLDLASFYWSSGQTKQAEQAIGDALRLEPDDSLANKTAAYFYIVTNRAERAEPYLKHVAETTHDPHASLGLADYYVGLQRTDDALRIFKDLTGDPSVGTTAKTRIAAIEFAQGNHKDGLQLLNDILARDAKNVPALVEKGRMLQADHRLDEAVSTARAAVAADAQSAAAHFLLGELSVLKRDTNSAVAEFGEVLKANPNATPAKVALADLHLAAQQPELAVEYAAQAAKDTPGDPSIALLYARTLIAKKDLPAAEARLRELIDRAPALATAHSELAKVYFAEGKIPEGRDALRRALTLDPNDVDAVTAQVSLALHDKQPAEAKKAIERALAAQPRHVGLLLVAANTYRALGDQKEQERALHAAIEADPADQVAYLQLVDLYRVQNRLDDARTELENLLKAQPRSVAPLTLVGMILETQHHVADAKKRYEAVLQIDPQSPVAANNLAWIYAEEGGNLDIALQLAQTAKAQLPENANIDDTLGWIYCKKDLASLAIPPLSESVRRQPNNPTYYYHLGVAYSKTGEHDKAKSMLGKALSLNPKFGESEDARRLLKQLGN